jgi:hypothetical protein
MASPSPLPPAADETPEPSGTARGLGVVVLLAVVLIPIAAIAAGAAWLWYGASHGAAAVSGAARVSEDLAPSAADRQRVATGDQGIDFAAVARGDVYPLREMSSGRQITDNGEPVYVTAEGNRVAFPVLFRDDFTSAGSGWDGGRVGAYNHGEYRLLTTIEGVGSEQAVHNRALGDFQARVDGRYVFVVTPDTGSFRLELWRSGEGDGTRTRLIGETRSPAIQSGTEWNRLVVRAVDADILLLVNGQVVGQVRDETMKTGALALGVGKETGALAFSNGDARFANLVVSAVK